MILVQIHIHSKPRMVQFTKEHKVQGLACMYYEEHAEITLFVFDTLMITFEDTRSIFNGCIWYVSCATLFLTPHDPLRVQVKKSHYMILQRMRRDCQANPECNFHVMISLLNSICTIYSTQCGRYVIIHLQTKVSDTNTKHHETWQHYL